jgi:hypothetical protein
MSWRISCSSFRARKQKAPGKFTRQGLSRTAWPASDARSRPCRDQRVSSLSPLKIRCRGISLPSKIFGAANEARIFQEASGAVNEIFVDNAKTREQNARPLADEHDALTANF